MNEKKILTLSNNFQMAKEYGDSFFKKSLIQTSETKSTDSFHVWNYTQGTTKLKFYFYEKNDEISYNDSKGAVILLDFADNIAFKYLIETVTKIWDELDRFIPVAVVSFWDNERLKNSTDNYVYVPKVTYGGTMEHICELVCKDLEQKVSDKNYNVFFKPLSKNNPELDSSFINYLYSNIKEIASNNFEYI